MHLAIKSIYDAASHRYTAGFVRMMSPEKKAKTLAYEAGVAVLLGVRAHNAKRKGKSASRWEVSSPYLLVTLHAEAGDLQELHTFDVSVTKRIRYPEFI